MTTTEHDHTTGTTDGLDGLFYVTTVRVAVNPGDHDDLDARAIEATVRLSGDESACATPGDTIARYVKEILTSDRDIFSKRLPELLADYGFSAQSISMLDGVTYEVCIKLDGQPCPKGESVLAETYAYVRERWLQLTDVTSLAALGELQRRMDQRDACSHGRTGHNYTVFDLGRLGVSGSMTLGDVLDLVGFGKPRS